LSNSSDIPPEQQQPYTPEQQHQQPYSQTNEEEPYYILKTNNPYTFHVPEFVIIDMEKKEKEKKKVNAASIFRTSHKPG
jgi:hypothetical protein